MTDLERIKLFNGEPSFKLSSRPFYSIVIACYESQYIDRLLKSIENQHMQNDIEVIISDDCSPNQDYLQTIAKYYNKISLKCVQTDYNCTCPGNTREKGTQYAEGTWLVFADHDDEFIEDTLKPIKEEIIQSGEEYLCIANFYNKDPRTNKIVDTLIQTRNWCHAKFFNLDNLWKKYNVHFKKDLLSHEDVYITTYTSCCLCKIKGADTPYFIDTFCYYWNVEPESLSRRSYNGREFIEVFYKDYLDATGSVYLDALKQGLVTPLWSFENCGATCLYLYFYETYIMQSRPNDYLTQNLGVARDFLKRVKQTFKFQGKNLTNQTLIQLTLELHNYMWVMVKERASKVTGFFMPQISYKDWLNLLDND